MDSPKMDLLKSLMLLLAAQQWVIALSAEGKAFIGQALDNHDLI